MKKTLLNLSIATIILSQSFVSQAAQNTLQDNIGAVMKMDYRTEAVY